jgi:hypothetical protein
MLALTLTALTAYANPVPHVVQAQPLPTLKAVEARLGSDKGLTEPELAKWAGPAIGQTPNGALRWKLLDGVLVTSRSPNPAQDPITCWLRDP